MPTTRKTIAFFEVERWEEHAIPKKINGHRLLLFRGKPTLARLRSLKDINVLSTFVFSSIDTRVLDLLPKLELIATRSTGYDHINLEECAKRDIRVANVPTYGENTVAEHTFALILSLAKHIHKAYERTIRGDFSREGLKGFDLKSKTIGVVGTGNIGEHVIRIAHGFEMNVLAYDIKVNKKCVQRYHASYVPLKTLFQHSDIVSFHVPLLPQTHHLLNSTTLPLLKRSVMIINTSRGGIIDTNALVMGLKKKIIGAVGLDVLEEEKLIGEEAELLTSSKKKDVDYRMLLEHHVLARFENVLLTPHSAFFSVEALQRILDTTLDNITSFIGGIPKNIVT